MLTIWSVSLVKSLDLIVALWYKARCPHLQIPANTPAASSVRSSALWEVTSASLGMSRAAQSGNRNRPCLLRLPPLSTSIPVLGWPQDQGTRVCSTENLVQGKGMFWATPWPVGHTLHLQVTGSGHFLSMLSWDPYNHIMKWDFLFPCFHLPFKLDGYPQGQAFRRNLGKKEILWC